MRISDITATRHIRIYNMPQEGALLASLLNSGLVQYPDKNLYNAASMLRADERPTVPVRTFTDPKPVYQEVYKQLGITLPENAKVGSSTAIATPDHKMIYVNQKNEAYKNLPMLAATMAHEQVHVARGDNEEIPAYAKGLEVIKRFAKKVPADYTKAYETQLRMRQEAANRQ